MSAGEMIDQAVRSNRRAHDLLRMETARLAELDARLALAQATHDGLLAVAEAIANLREPWPPADGVAQVAAVVDMEREKTA